MSDGRFIYEPTAHYGDLVEYSLRFIGNRWTISRLLQVDGTVWRTGWMAIDHPFQIFNGPTDFYPSDYHGLEC